MKVLCLGGAGKICRESTLDLVQFSDFDEITIGDYDEKAGHEVVKWLNNPRVNFKKVDIKDKAAAVAIMKGYDIVMDHCLHRGGRLPRNQPERFRRGVSV
jgi:lysine 6-dehydrogenase